MTDPEWLETDGLGGFAMGTVEGARTRRYHGLLITATAPPLGRMVLVAGLDASVDVAGTSWSLSTQRYRPDVTAGDGARFLERFSLEPWPTWIFRLPDGTTIAHELFLRAGEPRAFLSWRLLGSPVASGEIHLRVRAFLACRDFHALLHETPAFSFSAGTGNGEVHFQPFSGAPPVVVSSNGAYRHDPHWYRHFQYDEERARGLDFEEDLGAPGEWSFALGEDEAALVLSASQGPDAPAVQALQAARHSERARRTALGGPLDRAADQYLVARGAGRSVIAGYPWFGDWGRDTFVSLRGLCLARGQTQQALEVLSAWASLLSQGMLPNYFP
ncbi:MAG TPA: glycogen debranching enzyme N-terminal domain-containing protein, partial [Burkholderiaceae bacterium]|nr:glycogen debranching enzyme N-terminal domain-containing protein [Burkholderiaceae bacterium]